MAARQSRAYGTTWGPALDPWNPQQSWHSGVLWQRQRMSGAYWPDTLKKIRWRIIQKTLSVSFCPPLHRHTDTQTHATTINGTWSGQENSKSCSVLYLYSFIKLYSVFLIHVLNLVTRWPWLARNSHWRPGWLQTHSVWPVSASWCLVG